MWTIRYDKPTYAQDGQRMADRQGREHRETLRLAIAAAVADDRLRWVERTESKEVRV